ncbi:hypothetical protein [Bythopirellula polymerisocia]|uniref:DUF4398 domain-containing protein n=1 Tax=Bythopirellula polymerisocia TaxID=2528003 RepID=A0A5C6CY18_9BACT|nr:hypothetical protein [Bythopirellula polymerisocia]TWU28474.1 hypothetical protein Pla144_17640 [Bythopirellula polymerisocia]
MFIQKTLRISIALVVLAMCSTATTQQQGDDSGDSVSPAPRNSPSENMPEDNLSIAYARTCLRLAKAELAEAREQNRLVNKSVADYDIKRMLLQVRFAEQNLSHLEQGADFNLQRCGFGEDTSCSSPKPLAAENDAPSASSPVAKVSEVGFTSAPKRSL